MYGPSVCRALSVVVMLAAAVPASAIQYVWYEAVPVSPNAKVVSQGAPGQALILSYNPALGPVVWDFELKIWSVDGGGGSWALDLGTGTSLSGTRLIASNSQVLPNPYTSGAINQGSLNTCAAVMIDQGGFSASPTGVPPGTYLLQTFRVTLTQGPTLQTINILAAVGPFEFGGNDSAGGGTFECTIIGLNPLRCGYSFGGACSLGYEPLPVIQIIEADCNVITPATNC